MRTRPFSNVGERNRSSRGHVTEKAGLHDIIHRFVDQSQKAYPADRMRSHLLTAEAWVEVARKRGTVARWP